MKLILPLPPSPNVSSKTWQGARAKKNRYRMECWFEAVQQATPMVAPPEFVTVSASFFVHNLRDSDNLKASLKPALDALKQKQTGKSLKWKGSDRRAYFVDDDPHRCVVLEPSQQIDRKRPRLELIITPRIGHIASNETMRVAFDRINQVIDAVNRLTPVDCAVENEG